MPACRAAVTPAVVHWLLRHNDPELPEQWVARIADRFPAGMVHGRAVCAMAYLLDPELGRSWCRRGLALPRLESYPWPHRGVVDGLVLVMAPTGSC